MSPDQSILAGGTVIVAVGFIKEVTTQGGSPMHVIAGGVGVTLLASLVALPGGRAAQLAAAFVWLAVVTVLLTEGVPLFNALAHSQTGA